MCEMVVECVIKLGKDVCFRCVIKMELCKRIRNGERWKCTMETLIYIAV